MVRAENPNMKRGKWVWRAQLVWLAGPTRAGIELLAWALGDW